MDSTERRMKMEYYANEDMIDVMTAINTAMDSRTKPLHVKIEQLQAENEKLKKENNVYKALGENDWDLRCVNMPTGGDDYTIEWIVVEHYMAEPIERPIGHGHTPIEAIEQALCEYKNKLDG